MKAIIFSQQFLFYHKISFVDVKLISGAFVHFKTNYHITLKNVNRTTLIYLVTKSYFKNKIIYKKYLPYQSESVFHFPAKRMFKFSTSTTQTFVFKFFFLKSTSTCYIYFENVEKFTKTDPVSQFIMGLQ